jgi:hypothetical protein
MKEKGAWASVQYVQFHHGLIKRKRRKRPVQKSSKIFEQEPALEGASMERRSIIYLQIPPYSQLFTF